MALIGDVVVKIRTDAAQHHKELSKAQRAVTRFSTKSKRAFAGLAKAGRSAFKGLALSIGAATVAGAAFTAMMSRQADKIDKLAKNAAKLSIPIKEFQSLSHAAELSGVSVESLSIGMSRLARSVGDAEMGGKQTSAAFEKLGLSTEKLRGMRLDDQYRAVAGALANVTNETDRLTLGQVLLGRSAVDQMNLIKSNLGDLEKRYMSLNVALTDEQGKAVENFNDATTDLKSLWDGFINHVTAAAAPGFQTAVDSLKEQFKSGNLKEFAQNIGKSIGDAFENMIKALPDLITKTKQWGSALSSVVSEIEGIVLSIENTITSASKFLSAFKTSAQDTGARASQFVREQVLTAPGFGDKKQRPTILDFPQLDRLSGGKFTAAQGAGTAGGDQVRGLVNAAMAAVSKAENRIVDVKITASPALEEMLNIKGELTSKQVSGIVDMMAREAAQTGR